MTSSIKIWNLLNLMAIILFFSSPFSNSTFANEEASNEDDPFKMFRENIAQLKNKETKEAELESAKAFIQIFSLIVAKNKNYGINPSETVKLVHEAADMNIGCAQYALSTFYQGIKLKNLDTGEEIEYVKKDKGAELTWLKKAATSECSHAHKDLGLKYLEGQIVTANYKDSAYWFKEAALRGHPDAMLMTSVNYGTGKGFKKDKIISLAWVTLSIKYIEKDSEQLSDAKRLKSDIEGGLKMPAIAKAQNEANNLDKKIQLYMKQQSKQKGKTGARK